MIEEQIPEPEVLDRREENARFEAELEARIDRRELVVSNGYIYKIYFEGPRATDEQIAHALKGLGGIRVEFAAVGSTDIAVTPTIEQKENA